MSLLDTLKNLGNLGGFGGIVFTVRPWETMTFSDAEHNRSVEYAEHKIIGAKPKLEYVGANADEVKLNIKLSSYFGVNVKEKLRLFNRYMDDGDIYDLFIGTENLGEFVITSLSKKYKDIDFFGDITELDLSVTFKEYN
jgi:phage protein U